MDNRSFRVWQLLTRTKRARTLSLLALLILVAIVPLTLSLTQESTDVRQRAAEPTTAPSCAARASDTLLILDRSNSMHLRAKGGNESVNESLSLSLAIEEPETEERARRKTVDFGPNSKFTAAVKAATQYVDLAASDNVTRVGLITFAPQATVDSPFSQDYEGIKNKIAEMKLSLGTCIECAFKAAAEVLKQDPQTNRPRAVIFLTDGRPTRVFNGKQPPGKGQREKTRNAEQQAFKELQESWPEYKVPFYVIGLGKDVNSEWLKKIAKLTKGKYYFAPSEEQLIRIYQEIADILRQGTISGYVFSDTNGNKVWDKATSEKPLANWTINLKDASGNIIKTTSDQNGFYTFGGLCDGVYTVTEETQEGWTVTVPGNNQYQIAIVNKNDIKDKNFGNKPGGAILQFDIILHGVGAGGDTLNPNVSTLTNKNLRTPVRELNVQIFDTNGKKVIDTNSQITYNQAIGNFTGTIDVGNSFTAAQAGAAANKNNNNKNKNDKKDNKKNNFNLACNPENILLTTQAHPLTVTLTNKNDQPLSGKKITWEINQDANKVKLSKKTSTTTGEGTATTNISVKDAKDNGLKTTIIAKFVDGSGRNAATKAKCEIKATDAEDGLVPGVYTIKVKTQKYLRKLLPGTHNIKNGQAYTVPKFQMVAGDVNNDNVLNVLDYNILTDCYSDLKQPLSCPDLNKKFISDLTDNGKVDAFDYNLFIRELSVQQGD
ncbi:MAG: VWA domain-containing protein [Candidatus Levybacteria bacterium]|nr:VWA domain-containing protein [Candidatus Levybacteria bacterium]